MNTRCSLRTGFGAIPRKKLNVYKRKSNTELMYYNDFFMKRINIEDIGLRTLARWTVAHRTDARRTLARATRVRNKQ